MKILAQAWLMTWRDWRAGELRLLVVALMVAVGAVTAVGFFVDRIRLGLERDATQLLGGDVVLSSDRPLAPELLVRARTEGLLTVQTVTFPSMAQRQLRSDERGDRPVQLSAIKAVSSGYPLRGSVRVADAVNAPDTAASDIPAPGTVWVDQQLVATLGARVGDVLTLGESQLKVARIITLEPDRGAGFINFAPRVLMRLDELDKTGLVQVGSRVTFGAIVQLGIFMGRRTGQCGRQCHRLCRAFCTARRSGRLGAYQPATSIRFASTARFYCRLDFAGRFRTTAFVAITPGTAAARFAS
jgi:putative ABC transport system permease protein